MPSILSARTCQAVPSKPDPGQDALHSWQRVNERYRDWLNRHEFGVVQEEGGEPRPQTLKEIARLFGVTRQSVLRGINEARRVREALARAHELDYPCS